MINTNRILGNILGKPIKSDGKSKNKEGSVIVTWMQETSPDATTQLPEYKTLSREFSSRALALVWIRQMENAASGINKSFNVVSIK